MINFLQDLLRSELPDAIEKALKGDERYVKRQKSIKNTLRVYVLVI